MENKLQNIKDMHDILEHMHKIGNEWYAELVTLRIKNQDLERENTQLKGLKAFIDDKIDKLYENIDEKSSATLNKIDEIHTTDISDIQNQIGETKKSIAPLIEARKFYYDKIQELKQREKSLDERESKIKEQEDNLNERESKVKEREDSLDESESKVNQQKVSLDKHEVNSDEYKSVSEDYAKDSHTNEDNSEDYEENLFDKTFQNESKAEPSLFDNPEIAINENKTTSPQNKMRDDDFKNL